MSDGVSIVIPAHNRWGFLDELLASLENQTIREWEAIVVDDGSTDPGWDQLQARWNSGHFRWERHTSSRGPGAARNTGARAAQYDLIYFVDSDDLLLPDCLRRLREILQTQAAVDCAFPDYEFFGRENRIHQFDDLPISDLARRQFIPAHAMMRRALWERCGGFVEDEILRAGNEDWDFWLTAAEQGFRYHHLHETLYRYRVHEQTLTSRALRTDWQMHEELYRRHRRFIDCHFSRRQFLGPAYWRSAAGYLGASTWRSLTLGLRAFCLSPDQALLRDLVRRNLFESAPAR